MTEKYYHGYRDCDGTAHVFVVEDDERTIENIFTGADIHVKLSAREGAWRR